MKGIILILNALLFAAQVSVAQDSETFCNSVNKLLSYNYDTWDSLKGELTMDGFKVTRWESNLQIPGASDGTLVQEESDFAQITKTIKLTAGYYMTSEMLSISGAKGLADNLKGVLENCLAEGFEYSVSEEENKRGSYFSQYYRFKNNQNNKEVALQYSWDSNKEVSSHVRLIVLLDEREAK